jgi:hypothetical protein
MHNNEFERKVQQQMEEFKLSPSDAVWMNVQDGIRKEKRRRLWKYVPAAAAMLLLVPGYLLFVHNTNPAQKTNTAQTTSTVNGERKAQAPANQSTNNQNHLNDSNLYTQPNAGSIVKDADKNAAGEHALATDNANSASDLKQRSSSTPVTGTSVTNVPADIKSNTSATAKTNAPNAGGKNSNNASGANRIASGAALVAGSSHHKNTIGKRPSTAGNVTGKDGLATDNGVASSAKNNSKNQSKTNHNNQNNNAANKTNNVDPANDVVLVVPANDNALVDEDLRHALVPGVAFNAAPKVNAPAISMAQAKPIQVVRPSSWKWGIQITPGASNISKTYANADKDAMNTAQMSFAAGPYQRANSYVIPYSQPNNGAAFTIGMFMKKAFRKTSVEVGLNYSYYSASVKVGAKTDSTAVVRLQDRSLLSANTFYMAGQEYTYHNKYHFIELPVTVGFNMFHVGGANVIGTVGGTLAYMVDGKMLFRNSYGTHFENTSLLNRTQIFVNAGVGVEFNQNGKLPVTIGPVISYGVTPLAEPATSTGQHLISLGLKTSFQLQKIFK